jgi:CRISPR/Cas system-associated endonuclease Cas1
MYADFNEDLSRIGPRRDYDARDFGTGDIPNRCLSAATSCLYGLAEAAVLAAGYAPRRPWKRGPPGQHALYYR